MKIHHKIPYSTRYENEVKLDALLGKTLVDITITDVDENEILFTCSDGTRYLMYHEQDCCEDVYIEDICGEFERLLNTPITMAEDISNEMTEPPEG